MPLKFSALSNNISHALAIVGRAVPARSPLPIVTNVMLESNGGMIQVSGTDLTASIQTSIGAMIEEEGKVAVPFRIFHDLVRTFPDDRVDIDVAEGEDGKASYMVIKCGRHTSQLNIANAADFPPISVLEQGQTLQLDASRMEQVISKVKLSASNDDSRPILKSINIQAAAGDHALTFAAADGFRLSVCVMETGQAVADDINVSVPRDTMEEVERLCRNEAREITVTTQEDKQQIQFKGESSVIVSQIISGTFPNYEQLIPDRHQTRAVIDKQQFNRAVKAAEAIAADSSSNVRFFITTGEAATAGNDETAPDGAAGPETENIVPETEEPEPEAADPEAPDFAGTGASEAAEQSLVITARQEDVGDYSARIDVAECAGSDNKIAINIRYLADLDRQVKGDKMVLEMQGHSLPAVFTNLTGEDRHVVMPMYVQW